MLESDFLISLNNMVVTDNYDSNHFNSVFEALKKYCEADAVITDDFRKNENMISYKNIALSNNDIIINIEVISKRLVIKNVKKDFVNKDFFIKMLHVILNNIFKNYLMIEKLKKINILIVYFKFIIVLRIMNLYKKRRNIVIVQLPLLMLMILVL